MAETTDVAAIRARWAQETTAWWWTDQPDGVLRVAFVPLTKDGAVPSLPPDGFPGCAWWVEFPGDMEEYDGADLQRAEALAAAPEDIRRLLARTDALTGALARVMATARHRHPVFPPGAGATAPLVGFACRWCGAAETAPDEEMAHADDCPVRVLAEGR